MEHMLNFTGEKELSINDTLGARKNALILKIKLSQLAPALQELELGGIRIVHDKRDGSGENYLAVDINGERETPPPPPSMVERGKREGLKIPPAVMMRLNQAIFESKALAETEKKEMDSDIHDLRMTFKEDGLHISGSKRTFLFISVSFDTVLDFVSTGPDAFDVKLRKLSVAGLDIDFMSKTVLLAVRRRLHHALKGVCHFKYGGEDADHAHVLRVTVEPRQLIPAFPDLHLVGVDVRDGDFIMRIGRVQ
jgi:hypothetical protein